MTFTELNGNSTTRAPQANDDRNEPWSGIKVLVRHERIGRSNKDEPEPLNQWHSKRGASLDTEQLTQRTWSSICSNRILWTFIPSRILNKIHKINAQWGRSVSSRRKFQLWNYSADLDKMWYWSCKQKKRYSSNLILVCIGTIYNR